MEVSAGVGGGEEFLARGHHVITLTMKSAVNEVTRAYKTLT